MSDRNVNNRAGVSLTLSSTRTPLRYPEASGPSSQRCISVALCPPSSRPAVCLGSMQLQPRHLAARVVLASLLSVFLPGSMRL